MFDSALAENLDQLQMNKVYGLAMKLRTSLIEKKIRDLNATYLTLSLTEIAQKTNLNMEQLQPFIVKMILAETINAKINAKQSTVDFLEGEDDA